MCRPDGSLLDAAGSHRRSHTRGNRRGLRSLPTSLASTGGRLPRNGLFREPGPTQHRRDGNRPPPRGGQANAFASRQALHASLVAAWPAWVSSSFSPRSIAGAASHWTELPTDQPSNLTLTNQPWRHAKIFVTDNGYSHEVNHCGAAM